MKHNKIQLRTKRSYKNREKLFLFRKLTDIIKHNSNNKSSICEHGDEHQGA
jgi:hypothetical protein